MGRTLFTNVNVFDGTSSVLYPADVLVEGNRIKAVTKTQNQIPAEGAEVVDGCGATVMPGLVNTHSHITFNNGTSAADLASMPAEETLLCGMRNAKLILDHGFTACVGAASVKPRTEIVLRNEINEGRIPGPRLLAGTPELTVTGGLCDEYHQWGYEKPGPSIVCNGPDEFRKWVRLLIREGVDTVKFNASGDSFVFPRAAADHLPMSQAEIDAICETAKGFGRRLASHAHADRSVLMCIEKGVEFIYHASLASDDTIEKLVAAKGTHWVTPAIAPRYNTTYEAADYGITVDVATAIGTKRELELGCETMSKMHKAGVKVLPFGDYGFAWLPHGTDARDLEHFVNLMDFEPWEALRAATAYGGEAWAGDTGEKLGQVHEGFLADLLVVDGNPLEEIGLLQDTTRLLMIMKDGQSHKPFAKPAGAVHTKVA